VKVNVSVPDGTLLRNDAVIEYADDNGNYYDPIEDYAETTVTAPVMRFTKSVDESFADPGDLLEYTLFYENLGSGNATLVVINDTIPDNVTYVSSTPTYNSTSGNTYSWIIGLVEGYSNGTIKITVRVKVGVDDGTVLRNEAIMDYADDNGNYYDPLDDYAETTVTAPVMSFSKTASVSHADPGDNITYILTYENTGDGDATLVVIEDTIPAGVTFLDSDPDYNTSSGRTYTWIIGIVAGHSSGTITIIVKVNASIPDGTVLRNNATMEYADDNGNYYDPLEDYAETTVTAPVMTFSKTASVSKADPGDNITYILTYENTGDGNATLVAIEDTIPAGVTFLDSDPDYNTSSGRTYTWIIGIVAGHSSGTITIIVKVNASIPDGTVLRNNATMEYADDNGNYYDPLDDYAETTVTAPVMSFSKTADASKADPDDLIVYTLFYQNLGSGNATLVVINDTIPSDVTFVGSTPAHNSSSGNTYSWIIGFVEAYSNGTITITVRVNVGVDDGTVLRNNATMEYADENGNYYDPLEDYAETTVTAPVMSFSKTADNTTADPSDTVIFTLYYENSGSGNATLVVIEDTIPSDMTFVGSTPTHNSSSGNVYTWIIGIVPAYSNGTITITVTVNAGVGDGTVLNNTATEDYADANGNYYDQLEDYAIVTVTAPVLNITKQANVSNADPGDLIEYTIIFENTGTGNATNIWINDTIPSFATMQSTSPAHNSSSGDTYTWFFVLLESGDNITITIVVKVDLRTPDEEVLHNTVTMDYSDDNGNPLDPESAFADVTVTAPVLHIMKTANNSFANPDDTILYTIKYWNSGTGMATLVEIVDTIPAFTTFVGSAPNYTTFIGREYTWYIGDVGPDGYGFINITVKVNVSTPDTTLLHNVATLDYADANGNYYDQLSDYADVTVTAPVLHIIKTVDESKANPGDTLVYKIEYWNSGTGWATLVEIVDTIPGDTTHVSSSPAHNGSVGDAYTWIIGNVAPGANGTIWITVTVDVGTSDTTLLHNVATLDYADANGNYYPQLDDYADTDVTAPVLHIIKTVDESKANPGDTLVYKIEYWNSGTGWATLVEIVDTIPGDTTHVSSSPAHNSSVGDAYTWIIGNLAPGANGTIWITVTVDAGTPDTTLLHNVATLDYADANSNYYPQLDDYADTTVTAPDMRITKVANLALADPGTTITYKLTYTNLGTGYAYNVVIVDTIPDNATLINSNPNSTSSSGKTYTWEVGTVLPGTTHYIFINVTVDVGTPDKTLLRNIVTLDYKDPNNNSYPQQKDHADTHVTAPILTVKKTADKTEAYPSDLIIYTIKYENKGTGKATLVEIVDTIPDHTTFIGSAPNYTSHIGRIYTWYIGEVGPGGYGFINITVQVNVSTADKVLLRNEVTLDYADGNGNYYGQLDDHADVTVTAPKMRITKDASDAFADPGTTITYKIMYTNLGTGYAYNVVIVDTIPDNTTFVNSNPNATHSSGNTYTWEVGTVLPGTTHYIFINVTVHVGTPDRTLLRNLGTRTTTHTRKKKTMPTRVLLHPS
jgi:uncharacterized repeat protein (TIGR01451 family)